MKRIARGAFVLFMAAIMGAVMVGCGRLPADEPPASDLDDAVETTAAAEDVMASAEPVTMASRGLLFESAGDGTCRLIGMGSCTDTCLIIPDRSDNGEAVTAIGAGALAGNGTVSAVQIPAGVIDIGDGAFAGCNALSYISVSDGNSAYCDVGGLLYTVDKMRLLCVPAGSGMSALTLTGQLKEVAPRATEGCGFKSVLYDGDEADWKKITVGASNQPLTSLTPKYLKQSGK